jgi:hypothetical protein
MSAEFLGLAHVVAREWRDRQTVFVYDELVSICWLAGREAIPRFQPESHGDVTLSTYLVPRMRGAVKDALRAYLGRTGKHATMPSLDDPDVCGVPAAPSPEAEVVWSCELDVWRSRLTAVDQAILDAVLTHGVGGTEARLYAPVADRITLYTFRLRRGRILTQLKVMLRSAAVA